MKYELPTGEMTNHHRRYIREWKRLAQPILEHFPKWKLAAFCPTLLFRTSPDADTVDDAYFDVPLEFALAFYQVATGVDFDRDAPAEDGST